MRLPQGGGIGGRRPIFGYSGHQQRGSKDRRRRRGEGRGHRGGGADLVKVELAERRLPRRIVR